MTEVSSAVPRSGRDLAESDNRLLRPHVRHGSAASDRSISSYWRRPATSARQLSAEHGMASLFCHWRRPARWGEGEVADSSSRPRHRLDGHVGSTRRFNGRTDGGRTHSSRRRHRQSGRGVYLRRFAKCPANDDVFLAGTNRIWRTNDFFSSAMPSWTHNSQRRTTGRDSVDHVCRGRSRLQHMYLVKHTRRIGP